MSSEPGGTARSLAPISSPLTPEAEEILESIADAVLLIDREWRFTYCNSSALRLARKPKWELVGQVIWDVFPELQGSATEQSLHRAMRHRASLRWEDYYPLYRLWLESTAHPNSNGLMLTVRDISQRKRSEIILVGQKRVLELITEGATLTVVLESLCHLVEQQASEQVYVSILLLDQDCSHLRHGAAPGIPDTYNRAVDGVAIGPDGATCGRAAYFGREFITPDIELDPCWVPFLQLALDHGLRACWSTPILDRGGRVLGTFALYYPKPHQPDPSDKDLIAIMTRTAGLAIERKQAEEALLRQTQELARSNADLQQFAYVASHDLQEPIRTITSFSQLLAKRYQHQLDKEANEFLDFIVGGTRRMQTLIGALLVYSRVANADTVPLAPVAMDVCLQWAEMNLQSSIQESGAVVTHDPLPTVIAEQVQMVQLIQNLLSNAIKYSGGKPPEIHVSATPSGGEWRFCVQDNGLGIDPAFSEQIFGIFKRLHGREIPGTGIGLSVCKRILEKHGGRIWVESETGAGAKFYFTLSGD